MKVIKTSQYENAQEEKPFESQDTDTTKLISLLNELKLLDLRFANEVKFRETNQFLYDDITKKLSYIIGNLSYVVHKQMQKSNQPIQREL